jgi:hypothetical protein
MRSRPRRDLASPARPSTVHVPHGTFGDDPFGRGAERVARFFGTPRYILVQTRQTERDKEHGELIDKRHTHLEEMANAQNARIVKLLQANTELTQQDKELTQQVADLTREIHALLTKSG